MHQDLVDEPAPQALAGHVGAEDLQVLAARGAFVTDEVGGGRQPQRATMWAGL
jgi:hypothetical protein